MQPISSTNSNSYSSYTSFQRESQSVESTHRERPNKTSEAEASQVESSDKVDRSLKFDVNALVETVWGFASGRIAQAKADGASDEKLESLWQAAEKGVEQGFGEAKEMLASMEELSEPLKLKIDSAFGQIMDKLSDRSLEQRPVAVKQPDSVQVAPSHSTSGRAINLYQYERQTFELSLTTEQGDEILIRSVAEQESTAEDLKFGRLSSSSWGTEQSSGYSLVIKGDLNEQESKDLDALLAQVNELANEFYEGDHETAFNMAKELNIDGTSLKSMDLSMQEIEQKGASVYAQTAGQNAHVPKGLEPLKAYAEKLMAAQDKWQQTFNAPNDLLNSLENHPLNKGAMAQVAKLLMA